MTGAVTTKHEMIRDKFRQMFPHLGDQIVRWARFDKYSVKLDLKDGSSLIFEWKGVSDWRLQTLGNHLKEGK